MMHDAQCTTYLIFQNSLTNGRIFIACTAAAAAFPIIHWDGLSHNTDTNTNTANTNTDAAIPAEAPLLYLDVGDMDDCDGFP